MPINLDRGLKVVPRVGIEPTTIRLGGDFSSPLRYRGRTMLITPVRMRRRLERAVGTPSQTENADVSLKLVGSFVFMWVLSAFVSHGLIEGFPVNDDSFIHAHLITADLGFLLATRDHEFQRWVGEITQPHDHRDIPFVNQDDPTFMLLLGWGKMGRRSLPRRNGHGLGLLNHRNVGLNRLVLWHRDRARTVAVRLPEGSSEGA